MIKQGGYNKNKPIDYAQVHLNNQKAKEYVDKYCKKHDGKSVEDALRDKIVQLYIDEVIQNGRY